MHFYVQKSLSYFVAFNTVITKITHWSYNLVLQSIKMSKSLNIVKLFVKSLPYCMKIDYIVFSSMILIFLW